VSPLPKRSKPSWSAAVRSSMNAWEGLEAFPRPRSTSMTSSGSSSIKSTCTLRCFTRVARERIQSRSGSDSKTSAPPGPPCMTTPPQHTLRLRAGRPRRPSVSARIVRTNRISLGGATGGRDLDSSGPDSWPAGEVGGIPHAPKRLPNLSTGE
jgi:hypothetical protein